MQAPLLFIFAILALSPVFAGFEKNHCSSDFWLDYSTDSGHGLREVPSSFCITLQQDLPAGKTARFLSIGEDGRGYLSNTAQSIRVQTCNYKGGCYTPGTGFTVRLFSPTNKQFQAGPLSWFYLRCFPDFPLKVDFTGTKGQENLLNNVGVYGVNWVDNGKVEAPVVNDVAVKGTIVFNNASMTDFQHGWIVTNQGPCGPQPETPQTEGPKPKAPQPEGPKPTTPQPEEQKPATPTPLPATPTPLPAPPATGLSAVALNTCYQITANLDDWSTHLGRVLTGNMWRERCATTQCPNDAYAAVSNGLACFCFDATKVSNLGATPVDLSECNAKCTKNPAQTCGGPSFKLIEFVKVPSAQLSSANDGTSVDEPDNTDYTVQTPTEETHTSLGPGAIAGIVIGSILAVKLVVILVVLFVYKRRQPKSETF